MKSRCEETSQLIADVALRQELGTEVMKLHCNNQEHKNSDSGTGILIHSQYYQPRLWFSNSAAMSDLFSQKPQTNFAVALGLVAKYTARWQKAVENTMYRVVCVEQRNNHICTDRYLFGLLQSM